MAVGYFVSRAVAELDEGSVAFHDRFPVVRRLYRDIQEWTGITPDQLLSGELPGARGTRNAVLAIRSIAGQVAVHDVLAESGLHPDAVLALSLGITSASCMVGSLTRKQVFEMLWHRRGIPETPATEPEQGVAMFVERDHEDRSALYRGRDGVYLAVDFGRTVDGSRSVLLTGYKAALRELAMQAPDIMTIMATGKVAVHSSLQRHASEFVRAHVATLEFKDPLIPLAACLGPRPLTTGEEISETIWRNLVATASIPNGLAAALSLGVKVLVIPGPSMADRMIDFPVPTVRVRQPDDVEMAVAAVERALVEVASASGAGDPLAGEGSSPPSPAPSL
ncbi:Acyl transferase [Frankia sp. Hr75.2]|nr:Acyl transferase [Frankia sp. Hr75.2]